MKTRNGFVSNSSSTSYVLYIPPGVSASEFLEEFKKGYSKDELERGEALFRACKKAFKHVKDRLISWQSDVMPIMTDPALSAAGFDPLDTAEHFDAVLTSFAVTSMESDDPDDTQYINIGSSNLNDALRRIREKWRPRRSCSSR